MDGSVLITGGTSGLGLATATSLAAGGVAPVVITGRSASGAQATARRAGVTPLTLELGSLADIAAFPERLREVCQLPLGALVANAGLQVTRPTSTSDGFEATFAVNHLGHVALIAQLMSAGALRRGSRLVFVSSGTHDAGLRTGFPKPMPIDAYALAKPAPPTEKARESRRRYSTSKLANVMTAYALARRLSATGINVNAFDPGLMPGTGLARDASPVSRLFWHTLMRALVIAKPASTPRRSARALSDLAAGSDFRDVSGTYWSIDRERKSSAASYDASAQDRLWSESLALVGLEDPTQAART